MVAIESLAGELSAAMPELNAEEQRVAIALYRLLARAEPVAPEAVAAGAGLPVERIDQLFQAWPGVYTDDGRVIGFWGLALADMPHRLRVHGRELRAWCAWDTLFLPELLAAPATVESRCPTSGETISLEVVPGDGVRNVSPSTAVLSFLRREEPFDADLIVSFCHFVHFFRDQHAADEWTAQHPGTFTLSLDDGFALGELTNRQRFGVALSRQA